MKKKLPILLMSLLITITAFAESDGSSPYEVDLPRFDRPPEIDGKLDLSLWQRAVVLDTFVQYEPKEGGAPSEKTVAYLAYDAQYLYIAVRCYDSNPKAIRACLTQRDKAQGDDEVTIYLDIFNDKLRAFAFKLNPCGVQTDGIYTEVRRHGRGAGGFDQIDRNWDTFFLGNSAIDRKATPSRWPFFSRAFDFPTQTGKAGAFRSSGTSGAKMKRSPGIHAPGISTAS
jgi:hypothetical protein